MSWLIKKAKSIFFFVSIFGLISFFNFQVWGAEAEFLISGYSTHHQTNETLFIRSQKELDLLMRDLMSSKFSDYIPSLSAAQMFLTPASRLHNLHHIQQLF